MNVTQRLPILLLLACLAMTGCSEVCDMSAAIEEAYDKGLADGYRNGYAAARPGAGVPLTGFWRVVFVLASLVGAFIVLGSLILLMRILIHASRYPRETWGKRLAAGIAWMILFTLKTVFSDGIDAPGTLLTIYLLPASGSGFGKAFMIAFFALTTYALFSLLLRLPGWSRGVVLQAMMVFLLALIFGLLAASLRPLIFTPRLDTYFISFAVYGVLIGGMCFVARHLLNPVRDVDYSFFPYVTSALNDRDDGNVYEPEWWRVGETNGKEPDL